MCLGKKCFHAVNAKRREVSPHAEIMQVKFHVQFPLEPATQGVALNPAGAPIMGHFPFRQTFEREEHPKFSKMVKFGCKIL